MAKSLFDDLNQFTESRASTFYYTDQELEDILLPQPAFGEILKSEKQNTSLKSLLSDLEDLKKQEI